MFFRSAPTDFYTLHLDCHSHLIPGIDDGAKTMEDSLALIRGLYALGFRRIITTPHIYSELYPNDAATILAGAEEVKAALQRANLEIEFSAAAEYFMDDHFEELLEQKALLTFGHNHVLVEQSFFAAAPRIEEYIFRMRTKGYLPILAHPERYAYWHDKPSRYERLVEMGALLQVNLLSLQGKYGGAIKKMAKKLIKSRLAKVLGTDLHHGEHLNALEKMQLSRVWKQVSRKPFFNPHFDKQAS